MINIKESFLNYITHITQICKAGAFVVYSYADACKRHNKDERHSLLEKYTSDFIWKGCVWEGVGDRTELQHIDPHSLGHNRISFPFSWAAQAEAWGLASLGHVP